MNNQRLLTSSVVAPQKIAGAAVVVTDFVDMNNRTHYSFLVQIGELAAGEGVVVSLVGASAPEGADAELIAGTTYTAPGGGIGGRMIVVRGKVTPEYRYLAVKVSNSNTAAETTVAVALVSDGLYTLDDSDSSVLQV